MRNGLDSAQDLTLFAKCLKSKYVFVCRYYNTNNPSKNLSLAEASILNSNGLGIVVVWENGYPTTSSYFNKAKGISDGAAAFDYAKNTIGQTSGTPIYFSVDYDATDGDIQGVITEYFTGLNQGFNSIRERNSDYQIGVYGSGNVCKAMIDAGLASYSWLAQSTGWGGYSTFKNYNIKQLASIQECTDTRGGISADPDESPNDNEGSFSKTFMNLY